MCWRRRDGCSEVETFWLDLAAYLCQQENDMQILNGRLATTVASAIGKQNMSNKLLKRSCSNLKRMEIKGKCRRQYEHGFFGWSVVRWRGAKQGPQQNKNRNSLKLLTEQKNSLTAIRKTVSRTRMQLTANEVPKMTGYRFTWVIIMTWENKNLPTVKDRKKLKSRHKARF